VNELLKAFQMKGEYHFFFYLTVIIRKLISILIL
jgi:hypothetical protein